MLAELLPQRPGIDRTPKWDECIAACNSFTLEELLAERGREFIFEGKRRSDIRFGIFTTASWWDHQPSNDEKNGSCSRYRKSNW